MNLKRTHLAWSRVAEAVDVSYFDRFDLFNAALLSKYGCDEAAQPRFYVQDIFADYFIARGDAGALYRIPYTLSGNDVTLGDAQEVETAYVPVSEAGIFLVAEAGAGATLDDCVYPVTILRAGWGLGQMDAAAKSSLPHYYPPAFVSKVAEAANRAKFGRRHPASGFGENDAERIAGWFTDGSAAVPGEARANLNLLKSETDLRGKLSAAREAGRLDLYGLSILATAGFVPAVVEGRNCMEARVLGKLFSVDLCSEAGAGGRFLETMRVAASGDLSAEMAAAQAAAVKHGSPVPKVRLSSGGARGADRGGKAMNKIVISRVIEALRVQDAAGAAAFLAELNAAADDKHEDILARVSEALNTANTAANVALVRKAEETLAQAAKIQFAGVMESKLSASRLPEPAKKLVRTHLEKLAGSTEADLDLQITAVREAFAATSATGRITGISQVLLDQPEKAQLAMDRMLGVKEAASAGVPAFRGIREAYVHVTGDSDLVALRANGAAFFSRVSEAVATTDFPNLLLNSMTKRLLQLYKELGMGGLDLLYTKASVNDYKLQDRVREGYFGELPVVAEGTAYTEITKPTDERVNYAVSNRGNLLTISEQTIRNDDLGAIARFPDLLVRAGHRTLKNFISTFFISNTAYMADAVNWFDPAHSNLTTTALTQDALISAEIALMLQTEKDSGERLGLTLDWIMVPIQLAATARQINQTDTAGSNAFFHRFGANNERIIVNEKLTDSNDWYYGTMPDNAPFLEIGFLDGIEEPQIFLANNPTVGTQFTNDQLQYKVKQAFGGAIIDFRGVGKNVVVGA